MKFDDATIKQALLKGNYVSEDDIATAEEFAKKRESSIVEYLLSEGLISRDILDQAIAEAFAVPYANLNINMPSHEQIMMIPQDIAMQFRTIFFTEKKSVIYITTDNPMQPGIIEALTPIFPKKKIVLCYSGGDDIDSALAQYRKSLATRFSQIITTQKRVAPEIIEQIILDALTYHASDIHLEPQRDRVLVRFRVDGVLQEAGRIPREYYENILNRIKVQSHLRIDEHFAAQDGSMRYEDVDNIVDLRTSIVPTVDGEKVVLRVLSAYVQNLTLSELGLSQENQEIFKVASNKPFGMILVTGPTGSGKTTTLYSLLKILDEPDVNITTIEDPVEYKMLGINQIQVNQQTGLTFAKGLRSIVRQDPDIILVGEIRDEETVEISINAALTGHLLFSTFHANDAATAIPRLLDMGAEEFLLSSTLELIVAQRLVRKICTNCRRSVTVPLSKIPLNDYWTKAAFGKKEAIMYEGKGCPTCDGTGFRGRTAIFEFIKNTQEMRELILKSPSSIEVWDLARKQGTLSLFEDGIEKVKGGITTLDELLRVAEPPVINLDKKIV
ncbi:MAG: GspE/PulE family protein [Candidatus Falkowbacteria bacterium]